MADQTGPSAYLPQPPLLVGRERELATLRDAFASAMAGRGALVLIGGEAGIGKTALAEALLAEATAHGALALVGRCYDLSETPPYGPWAEALARAPRDAAPAAPLDLGWSAGVGSQATLFSAVRDHLGGLAARRPLVLLLDDLHWADRGSLDLLRFLGRQLADLPIVVLAIYRSNELTRGHPLYALLPLLVREARARRLDLAPLDEAGLSAVVARYALPEADGARLVAYLRGRAEGNPFFAVELLRTLEETGSLRRGGGGWALGDMDTVGVPPLLRQVLDARVDRLGEAARALLMVAAVIGQAVPLDLWQTVTGADEDALLVVTERATGAGLLAETPGGAGVRFAHALVREALYDAAPALRRRRLHRRAGEVLADAPAPDPDAVAYHFRRAGDERLVDWLVRAGERARAAHAYVTASARMAEALPLLEAAGDAGRAGRLAVQLAFIWRHVDRQRALGHNALAVRYAEEAGDPVLLGAARCRLGATLCFEGELERGLRALRQGVGELAGLPAGAWARTHAPWVMIGSVREARALLAYGLAVAGAFPEIPEQLGYPLMPFEPALAAALASGGSNEPLALAKAAGAGGHPWEAVRAWKAASAIFRAIAEAHTTGITNLLLLREVLLPYFADDVALRVQVADEIERDYTRAQDLDFLSDLPPRSARYALSFVEGAWDEARARALVALPRTGDTGWEGWPLPILCALARARGDTAEARRWVREGLPEGPGTAPGTRFFHTAMPLLQQAACLAIEAGDLATARLWLEAHDRWSARSGAVLYRSEGRLAWAASHRAVGDAALAREHAEAALARATEPRQPLALLAAHRFLGELATVESRHTAAAAHLSEALTLARACAAPYERALTLLALAELRLAAGDRDGTGSALAEARAILEPLTAHPAQARADALAAAIAGASGSGATALPSASPPFGLSAREAQVLALVARGLSSPEVAARLFLSPRTVEQHLRAIFNKLGVDNRTAATRLAVERGLA